MYNNSIATLALILSALMFINDLGYFNPQNPPPEPPPVLLEVFQPPATGYPSQAKRSPPTAEGQQRS